MCTAATYKPDEFYFGRNLDYEFSYGESIAIMPRSYAIKLRCGETISKHYAMLGMAHIRDDFPLYYDAANEAGLCIAGLNFVGNAFYQKKPSNRKWIATFELIPLLLAKCRSIREAKELIGTLTLTDEAFAPDMPPSPLHWMIADKNDCIVLEATRDGVKLYEDPVGVLTNNPPFPTQLLMLNSFANLSPKPPINRSGLPLSQYSRGMGAIGLPGDLSSASRFARAAFTLANSKLPENPSEKQKVAQFFHILGSVEQQRGCCELDNSSLEYTIYSSCINADRSIYYFRTYFGHQTRAVELNSENLDSNKLISYPLEDDDILKINSKKPSI